MGKSDIFIADAHIDEKDSLAARKLVQFLEHIKGTTRTLYILGDLFDFWFDGGKSDIPPLYNLYKPVLDKLKELSGACIKIVYCEGNHDFFMGKFFTDVLKASVYVNGGEVEVDGKKIYITHGDTINSNDKKYLWWRQFIRSPRMFSVMKAIPDKTLLSIAKWMSKKSRNKLDRKIIEKKVMDEFLTDKYDHGVSAVIFAHTHAPLLYKRGDKFCVNPGAFADDGSYIQYKDGIFSAGVF